MEIKKTMRIIEKLKTNRIENKKYFDLHFFEYYPKLKWNSLPTSFLFKKASDLLQINNDLERDYRLITNRNGFNSTLWGIKNEEGILSVEYYFYFKKKYPQNSIENLADLFREYNSHFKIPKIKDDYFIISINPLLNEVKEINIYYPIIDENQEIRESKDVGYKFNFPNARELSLKYEIDTNEVLKSNLYFAIDQDIPLLKLKELLAHIGYPKTNIIEESLKLPYLCHSPFKYPIAIAKKEDAFGYYFFSLNISEFIDFLKYHHYPTNYIKVIENNKRRLNHIKFDIGIDFTYDNYLKIKKTSFYGSI